MSGAASALASIASANRLSGIMSALNLLSVIAPVVPGVPQGSPGEAASGFRALLATLSGESDATAVTGGKTDLPSTGEVLTKAETDSPVVAGFLTAPATVPSPLVLPAQGVEATRSDAQDMVARTDADGAGTTLPPAPTGDDADRVLTTTLPLTDKVAPSKPQGPEVQPSEPGVKPPVPEVQPSEPGVTASKPPRPEVQPPAPEDLPPRPTARALMGQPPAAEPTLVEAAAATAAAEVRARTGAAPTGAVPVAPPPPLRPLAERTGRALEAPVASSGDASRAVDPARPTRAIQPALPSTSPTATADFAAAFAARDMAKGGEPDGSTHESPLPLESTTSQSQEQAAARETGGPQISRAAIEATTQIAAQILRRLEGRSTRFEMALTPDELGRVDVKLDIDSEGRLNARLAFDNPAAATDLRGRADELRRQLEDAGFHLADDAFEFAERDSDSSAFDRGQNDRNTSSRAFAAASRINADIDVAQPPRWMALSLSPSGVDMKV